MKLLRIVTFGLAGLLTLQIISSAHAPEKGGALVSLDVIRGHQAQSINPQGVQYLEGTLRISGTPTFGQTLTCNLDSVSPQGAQVNYFWYRNATAVHQQSRYTLTPEDIGCSIYLVVIGTDGYDGLLRSESVTVTKATPAPPGMLQLLGRSSSALSLVPLAGCEYQINEGAWQKSNIFDGLQAGTSYRLRARYAETATHFASNASIPLAAATESVRLYGELRIRGEACYGQLLTADISDLHPQNATLHYVWKRGSLIVGREKSYPISAADIGQMLTVTVTASGSANGSCSSAGVLANKAQSTAQRITPQLLQCTDTRIQLKAQPGYEYRLGNGAWQASGSFSNLKPKTGYYFYARATENATHLAGEAGAPLYAATSASAVVSTAPKPTTAPTTKAPTTTKYIPAAISSGSLTVGKTYIRKISENTSAAKFLSQLNEKQYIKLYKNEQTLTARQLVSTGTIARLLNGTTLLQAKTLVITGDISGDGVVSLTDFVQLKAHILGKRTLKGCYLEAADLNGDAGVTLTDFVQMKMHLQHKKKIMAN